MKRSLSQFIRRLYGLTGLVAVLLLVVACAESDTTSERLELIADNMRRGDYGAASLELANLIQSNPDHLEARLLQGKVSLAAGRPQAAETQLFQARRLGAPDEVVLIPLGRSVMAQGQFDRAIEMLGARPEKENDAIAWSVVRGYAELLNGRIDEASSQFRFITSKKPENLDGLIGQAKIAMHNGNSSDARQLLKQATEIYPVSIAAWQALGAFYFNQKNYLDAERSFINAIEGTDGIDRAQEYMLARVGLIETQWSLDKKSLATQNTKELIESYPWHPLPKYLRGLLAFYDAEYATSSDYLQRVLDVLPNHGPSLKLMAALNSAQGNLGRAQTFLNRYFELHPVDTYMVHLLADTYLKMGNADQALETLQPVTANTIEDVGLLDLLATASMYSGRNKDGIKYLQNAVNLEPENIYRQTRLAASYLNQGMLEQADTLMRSWETQSITENSRQILRLERFLRSNQIERANEYAKKLRRENPSDLHALLALAEIAEIRGTRKVALDWLEIARDRNKTALEPRFLLIILYAGTGNHTLAIKIAQEAAAAHPHNSEIMRLLAESSLAIGDTNGALAAASESYRLAPGSLASRLMLIRAQLAASDFWNGRSSMAELLEEHPAALSLIRPLIVEEFSRGNKEQAFDLVKTLKSRFPDHSVPHELEGDLYQLDGNSKHAAESYRIAMKKNPTRLNALKLSILTGQEDPSSKTGALRMWLENHPTDKRAKNILNQLIAVRN